MAISTRTGPDRRFGTVVPTDVEISPQDGKPSTMRSFFYWLQGYFVFLVLKLRHRSLLGEIETLAYHLEEYVFPSLRESQHRWLTLEVAEESGAASVNGRSREKHFSFPDTPHLAEQMQRMDLDKIKLDTTLEYYQVVETMLMLVYVGISASAKPGGTERYTGWTREKIAGRMLSESGFHRFCTTIHLRRSQKEYAVEYTYCEPYFSEMVQRYVSDSPKYGDHARLISAAPKLAFLAFLISIFPLFFLRAHAANALVVWPLVSGVVALALYAGIRTISSIQYNREHRDKLIDVYLKEISNLSLFPESNPNPQIKLNMNGEVLYANQATRHLLEELGASEDAVEEILPPGFKDILVECLNSKGEIHESEVQTRGKSFRFRFSPFPDGRSFIASGNDVTYLKDIEHKLRDANVNLEATVESRTTELHSTQEVVILSLAGLAEMRDPETGEHLERTRRFVKMLAQKLQQAPDFKDALTREAIHTMYMSAPLHDIGKVGISDAVLLKPGKLTTEEFEEMKKHAEYGGAVLDKAIENLGFSSFLDVARDIAHHHHEKWDGSGYPSGLEGDAIPLAARIMALADVYDALTSKRPYKEPWPHARARDLILKEKGKHFDPGMVDAFIDIEAEFDRVAQALRESEG